MLRPSNSFPVLSPEEQQAYLEEQRSLQAQREYEAYLFMLWIGAIAMYGSSPADTVPTEAPYDPYEDVECAEVDGWYRYQ